MPRETHPQGGEMGRFMQRPVKTSLRFGNFDQLLLANEESNTLYGLRQRKVTNSRVTLESYRSPLRILNL